MHLFANKIVLYAICSYGLALSANASTIDIPLGPALYGVDTNLVDGALIGSVQDAQSFIAQGSALSEVSVYLRAQACCIDSTVLWQFELWSDLGDQPFEVIAQFGSYGPTTIMSIFTAVLSAPIPLTTGDRYYIGMSPILGTQSTSGFEATAIFLYGWIENSVQDVYANGTVWAIRNPGPGGEVLLVPNDFDYSISITTVPLPSSLIFLFSGIAFLNMVRVRAN